MALVDRFYDRVETDPVLRPMYPPDLSGPRRRLAAFLVQRWGGPRCIPPAGGIHGFGCGIFGSNWDLRAQPWVRHMAQAVHAGDLDEADELEIMSFFAGTATMVINHASPRQ